MHQTSITLHGVPLTVTFEWYEKGAYLHEILAGGVDIFEILPMSTVELIATIIEKGE